MDVGNLFSASSAFSKSSLNIWKFSVHILLKLSLENFQHYWLGHRLGLLWYWYVNRELPDVQARFRKGRGTRDQIANIHWNIEKVREFQKNICFCFIDYAKAFDCVDHNKLWKILEEMGIPDHLTCLLRNLHAGQEATVRTGHGTTDWFQVRKGVHHPVYCHSVYLTYMQSISWETLG